MVHEFEIMKVVDHHNRGQFIFARKVKAGQNFEIKEGSLLGGIPIYHYLEMPRMLGENGQPRLDIFVFRPLALERISSDFFQEGQLIELIIPD